MLKTLWQTLFGSGERSAENIEAVQMQEARESMQTSVSEPLTDAIHEAFIPRTFYSLKDIKSMLSEIYERLGIEKTAKATDLLNMDGLNVKAAQEKVDGHKENGYRIL